MTSQDGEEERSELKEDTSRISQEDCRHDDFCPMCGGRVYGVFCDLCGVMISMQRSHVQIRVSGNSADEVQTVARALAEDAATRREVARLGSPWFSGLFYLTLVAVVIALLLVAGSVLALWALPIVVLAAALLVSIVGALQMRQDDRLSERGFLHLMGDVLRRLPLLLDRAKAAEASNDGK